VVEDSQEDVNLLTLEFIRAGYRPYCRRVETAGDLTAALDEQEWDAILCDYSMPALTIQGTLSLVRQRKLDIPFLIVSGNIVDEEAVAAMRAGAHDFIMKDRLARLVPAVEREIKEASVRLERRIMGEKLLQTQKLESLGLLAGGIAHDFNNLLTGILANASSVRDGLPPGSPDREMLELVVLAAERAADLTRQLLAYSGRGKFIIEPVDLPQLLRESGSLMAASLPKGAELVLELACDLPPVEGDRSQLQQLMMNLIVNGAEAIGNQRGIVRVHAGVQEVDREFLRRIPSAEDALPGTYVCVEVQDSGCGIAESIQPKIFDPFFSTKFAGRGLGLAAAQGIIRGHSGFITVDSVPGQGSSFHVFLPASERELPVPDSSAATGMPLTRGAILVIDDEPLVQQSIQLTLNRQDYTVLVAENAASGVETFRRMADQVSLVLLDMTMPDMSGEEALAQLQRIRPAVRVLLSSGFDETEANRRFHARGLCGFIQKPYTARQLLQKISAILRGAVAGAADCA
jgi:signal transduction histidine kinase